jgi:hypothetical protein
MRISSSESDDNSGLLCTGVRSRFMAAGSMSKRLIRVRFTGLGEGLRDGEGDEVEGRGVLSQSVSNNVPSCAFWVINWHGQ